MALGAITQQNLDPALSAAEPGVQHFSGLQVTRNSVVGDTSYPTGGSALTAAQLGLPNKVLWASVTIKATTGSNNGATSARYDEVNGKLQCFTTTDTNAAYAANQQDTTVEVTNGTNLSGLTFDVVAFGY
jgi:hypothetical protein